MDFLISPRRPQSKMRPLKVNTIHVEEKSPDTESTDNMSTDNMVKPKVMIQPTQIAKPLFLCMAFMGVQKLIPDSGVEPDSKTFSSYKIRCGFYWCVVTAILVWANIFRLLPSYKTVDGFDEDTFIKIVIFVWYLQCGINIIVCFRANANQNLLHRLYEMCTKYCENRSFERHAKSLRKVVWFLVASYIMFVACNIVLIAYIMYSGEPSMIHFTSVLYTPFGEHEVVKVVLMLFQAFVAGSWILPLWLFALVCIVNKYLLDDTRLALDEDTDPATQRYGGELEDVRLRHEAVCDMVQCADDTFSVFVALGLATDIPLGCFVMYMMLWPDSHSSYLVIFNTFLMVMAAFHLTVIMWSASRVNTEAHAAFTQLHKMRAGELSEKNQFQLLVFLSRLQGPPIGMTAWQLFTIDRPSLLTIISIILTYFVILIQLRMPSGMVPNIGGGNSTAT